MTLQERLARVRQYLGWYIQTERPVTAEERAHYGPEVSDIFGGAGILVDVLVENDQVHVVMDWGVSWIITDDTTIVARITPTLAVGDVVKIPHVDVKVATVVSLGTMEFPGLILPTIDVLVAGRPVTYLTAELELA